MIHVGIEWHSNAFPAIKRKYPSYGIIQGNSHLIQLFATNVSQAHVQIGTATT